MKKQLIFIIQILILFISHLSYSKSKYWDDKYFIGEDMIENTYKINEKKHEMYFLPIAVFRNESLDQCIMIELYTDYFKSRIFHFYTDETPNTLIKLYEPFITENNIHIDLIDLFKRAINEADTISNEFFKPTKSSNLV